jgi:pseudaminic acid cytidylyltransferase
VTKVAVIPARGGSKRIPRKNVRDFCGRPILAYSIDAARESGLFARIVVSTDDPEIAAAARAHGAEAPFVRPSELADDHAGTEAVMRHCVQWLGQHGETPEYACCIYATAPFVRAGDLREAYTRLRESGKAYVFSVTTFEFPVQRALRLAADGAVEALWPQFTDARSQDLEQAWHDAGQFYWGTARAFLDAVPIYSKAALGFPVPRHLVQDIDTPEDWTRAELMFRALRAP